MAKLILLILQALNNFNLWWKPLSALFYFYKDNSSILRSTRMTHIMRHLYYKMRSNDDRIQVRREYNVLIYMLASKDLNIIVDLLISSLKTTHQFYDLPVRLELSQIHFIIYDSIMMESKLVKSTILCNWILTISDNQWSTILVFNLKVIYL